jgi:hypothetical protein
MGGHGSLDCGRTTLTRFRRPGNADPGAPRFRDSAPVPTPEFRFRRRDRDWFERSGCRAITRMRKQMQGAAAQLGTCRVSPARRVFPEMYLGHQSIEHGHKASFDRDPPVRP